MLNWQKYVDKYKLVSIVNENDAIFHWRYYGRFDGEIFNDADYFDSDFYIKYNNLSNVIDKSNALSHYTSIGYESGLVKNPHQLYVPTSDITYYFDECVKKMYRYASIKYKIANHIDLDLFFYKVANHLCYNNIVELVDHFHIYGHTGLIYHPKQLMNIFPQIKFFNVGNDIYTFYNKKYTQLNTFLIDNLYSKTFDQLASKLVNVVTNNCRNQSSDGDNNLLIMVFIGNTSNGNTLIDKINNYKNIEPSFDVAFCINNTINYTDLLIKIKGNFTNYSIYLSNEFGNDIVPTLITYYNITHHCKYENVIKLHTKKDKYFFDNAVDFLLHEPVNKLKLLKKNECNCIGNNSYYMGIDKDSFNGRLYKQYNNLIETSNKFCAGTIFLTTGHIMDTVVKFIINNNFKSFLLNNMYDNNSFFYDNSPVHILERLFGTIKIYDANRVPSYMDLPNDFDWKAYAQLNRDLCILNENQAIEHYQHCGQFEDRKYKKVLKSYQVKPIKQIDAIKNKELSKSFINNKYNDVNNSDSDDDNDNDNDNDDNNNDDNDDNNNDNNDNDDNDDNDDNNDNMIDIQSVQNFLINTKIVNKEQKLEKAEEKLIPTNVRKVNKSNDQTNNIIQKEDLKARRFASKNEVTIRPNEKLFARASNKPNGQVVPIKRTPIINSNNYNNNADQSNDVHIVSNVHIISNKKNDINNNDLATLRDSAIAKKKKQFLIKSKQSMSRS
jgi:hypothetical protein